MVISQALVQIGYWDGPDTTPGWPSAQEFLDASWDPDDRDMVAEYLSGGVAVWHCMGYSLCRFCGIRNGVSERSDGVFLWPEGLAHYLTEHSIRLPDRFTEHVRTQMETLESATRDADWWRSVNTPVAD